MFVAYCDPSEPYEPITEWHSDAHSQPNNIEQDDDDDYLRNPVPENEHVGVDEENIYLEDELVPLIMVPCSNKGKDKTMFLIMRARLRARLRARMRAC